MQGPHKKITKIRVSVCARCEAEHKLLEKQAVKVAMTGSPEMPQTKQEASQQGKPTQKMHLVVPPEGRRLTAEDLRDLGTNKL